MNIDEIKIGMHVIPISSTHPMGKKIEEVLTGGKNWRRSGWMYKGYLIVCDKHGIGESFPARWGTTKDDGLEAVRCYPEGRKMAWGNDNIYDWLWFRPEDLVPVTANEAMRLKYMQGGQNGF